MSIGRRAEWLLSTGVAGPVAFFLAVTAGGALRSEYSHVNQYISELGETGGEFAWLMNYFGFMLSATLMLIFVLVFRRKFRRTAATMLGTLLLAVFAVCVFLAGVFSCDMGCPATGRSPEQKLHDSVSVIAFLVFVLAVVFWGSHFLRLAAWKRFGQYSMMTAGVSVILLGAMIQSEVSRSGTGLYQRLFLGVLFLWLGLLAVQLLWRGSRGETGEGAA